MMELIKIITVSVYVTVSAWGLGGRKNSKEFLIGFMLEKRGEKA